MCRFFGAKGWLSCPPLGATGLSLVPDRTDGISPQSIRCSTACYGARVSEVISQRELRNDSGRIMRALDEGRTFVLTRNSVPVGELRPLRRQRLVDARVVSDLFRHAPRIDGAQFRGDLGDAVDQDAEPRA